VCGRFVSSSSADQIGAYFGAEQPGTDLGQNYNVAPTNDVYAVVAGPDGTRRVEVFHWGLVPIWAKDIKIGSKMINARAETLADKSAFKPLLKAKRCIIPMDGFYEWKSLGGLDVPAGLDTPTARRAQPAKQPMFIHRSDDEPLAVAGLWSPWRDPRGGPDAPWLHSTTVITTSANETLAPVHDRMPVILPASAWTEWLDPGNGDIDALRRLLVPAPNSLLTMHAVSTEVNRVANKGPELIEPLPTPAAGEMPPTLFD
jgi:putative SOS response-associated peptidase YedK